MSTVLLGTLPPEVKALIDRRRAHGQDLHDEVWNGNYVMAPAPRLGHGDVDTQLTLILHPLARAAGLRVSGPFNLGDQDDYRVPDRGVLRDPPVGSWLPTAAIVVEIVSPDDATWDKLAFYADHAVDELLIVDLHGRTVHWQALTDGEYVETDRSTVLDIDVAVVADAIDWPE